MRLDSRVVVGLPSARAACPRADGPPALLVVGAAAAGASLSPETAPRARARARRVQFGRPLAQARWAHTATCSRRAGDGRGRRDDQHPARVEPTLGARGRILQLGRRAGDGTFPTRRRFCATAASSPGGHGSTGPAVGRAVDPKRAVLRGSDRCWSRASTTRRRSSVMVACSLSVG